MTTVRAVDEDELRKRILRAKLKNAPFTAGPLDAKICFIGEAPGAEEEREKGAFVGRAGRLLRKLTSAAGINLDQCRLENVFQFRPPENNIKPFFATSANGARTSPEFEEAALALKERLTLCSANILVPLGNVSMFALCRLTGITKYRGSLLQTHFEPRRKVIPTIHPSAALRGQVKSEKSLFGGWSPNYQYFMLYDLKRIREESLFPEINLPERNLLVEPSYDMVLGYLEELLHHQEVAYDIETSGNHLSHIAFSTSSTSALCIPLYEFGRETWNPEQETTIMRAIGRVLESQEVVKIGQNLSFDASFMYYHYGIHVRPLQDTMIAAGILFPDFPKGLDFLTSIYCNGTPYYKSDGKEWRKNPFGDSLTFRRYNAMDAAVLQDIWPKQREELRRMGNWTTYEKQLETLLPLVFIGTRGIQVDLERLEETKKSCGREISEVEKKIRNFIKPEINLNSTKQLMSYFYLEKGFKPFMRQRKTGDSTETLDEKALLRLAAKGVPEASLLLEHRKLTKLKSTYLEIKLDPDNRLRSSFNPVGTVQGRISSSKTLRGTGANFQNLAPEFQQFLIADEGYLFICPDYAQAENRVVAYEACEHNMMQAFEQGIDIHKQTGCLIHGVPLEKCTSEIRTDGKVANHGLNFGLGFRKFAEHYQLELDRSEFIYNRYHEIYPGVREWHNVIRHELSSNQNTLVNCFGRKRKFIDPWGEQLFNKAYDYKPQSAVAMLTNQAFCYLYYDQHRFPEVILSNTVHDSIWFLVPLSVGFQRIVERIRLFQEFAEKPLVIHRREVRIPIELKIGFSISKKGMLEWTTKDLNLPNRALTGELESYVKTAR